jgi:hypothetical protein
MMSSERRIVSGDRIITTPARIFRTRSDRLRGLVRPRFDHCRHLQPWSGRLAHRAHVFGFFGLRRCMLLSEYPFF